jgi:CheY-like chemotaxis protein
MDTVGMATGQKVLVVEDEYLIARDLSETLEQAGIRVVGPVATLDAAMALLDRHDDIAGAVLDVKLRGGAVYPVAEALRLRGVPFVLATGYDLETIAPAFRNAIHCEKPVDASKVVRLLLDRIAPPPRIQTQLA